MSNGSRAPVERKIECKSITCGQARRLKSCAPSERFLDRGVQSTRFLGFSAFPNSVSLLIGNKAFFISLIGLISLIISMFSTLHPALPALFHRQDDFADIFPFHQDLKGIICLFQRECGIDHRFDLSGFKYGIDLFLKFFQDL